MNDLTSLYRGFRERYLDHAELTAQLRAWAEAWPDLVRLRALCTTEEGREQWLLTVGREPDRIRPAVWVDGNMHAGELAGSSVALAIAEDAIALHLGSERHDLAEHVREVLRDVVFHVLPRVSPDGAEAVLGSGRYVRSLPRDRRVHRSEPYWVCSDVDGDGLSLVMRKQDPGGELVESRDVPGLMLPRRLEDRGPFYKVWPEGLIENWDGHTVPDPHFLSDNDTDLNRNFPWSWQPEPEQVGAGRFPGSEPESRSILEFASAHPEIFAWMNLHTFGGCFIRPLGDKPDDEMHPSDLALYRQVGEWAEQFTTYPMVSGFEEFTYEPKKPIHGDMAEWAYRQRGCIAYVVELWDLFRRIGVDRKKRFVEHYTHLTREDMVSLGRWDAQHNGGRVVRPWRKAQHPQLGEVEVGGIDARFGITNPPESELPRICRDQSAAFLHVAALAPRLVLSRVDVQPLGGGLTAIELHVENQGYLPTYILSSSRGLPWNQGVWVEASAEGCAIEGERRHAIGHLDGWGRGLFDGTGALYYLRSRGNGHAGRARLIVRGAGAVTLRVGSSRTGYFDHVVEV